MAKTDFDLCVIGGGAGGLVVAAGGAALGAKVALVERGRLGGDCLWTGCVPSKTLLHAARLARRMRDAGELGLPPHAPAIELAAVLRHVEEVVEGIAVHDSPERFRGLGVELIFGAGRFADPRTFLVAGRRITARRYVIATGSRPALPALPGLTDVPYLTNETVFALREPVPQLLVLGGGPMGVELAQACARLGSRVTLVERGPRLLPAEDPDCAAVVEQALRADGVALRLDTAALRVAGTAGAVRLAVRDGAGQESELGGTHLLLAVGRRANSDGLGLDAAGVRLDGRGYVATDTRLRTSARHIYACGDVTGRHLFTHIAEHHAGVVLRNALFCLPARIERRAVPWCTYSDPELARVGLSETEARQQGIRHAVYTFPFRDIDRARTDAATAGFAKLVTDPRGRLLGATLVGAQAGELIHEYVLALAKGLRAQDLSRVIHVYPTLAQINRRVADQRLKAGLTPRARRWLQRIFRLRGSSL